MRAMRWMTVLFGVALIAAAPAANASSREQINAEVREAVQNF